MSNKSKLWVNNLGVGKLLVNINLDHSHKWKFVNSLGICSLSVYKPLLWLVHGNWQLTILTKVSVFAKQFINFEKRDTKIYKNKSLHTFNKC